MIRKCIEQDVDVIFEIINNAAQAYKGVIPADRWHEPYMSQEQLKQEIDAGVTFWGFEKDGNLVGAMGIQDKGEVTLIRHSYVRKQSRSQGIGTILLQFLESMTDKPILIGTWVDATWAIAFYEKNGYRLISTEEKNHLLRKYWTIPERQIETSVVLVGSSWVKKGGIMTKSEQAVSKFMEGYNCAQSVFFSFCDDLKIEKDKALKIACGFGAGMGRKEEVCGAVTGGIIVIGAKYGRGANDDRTATEETYAKTRELMDQFAERHGTFICRKLLNGCELTTEEGQKQFIDELFNKTCKPCVQSVVEILENIMR
jgi:C_GCAxxG_C_C family probable redox protein